MGDADRRTRTVRRGGAGVIRSIDVHAHIMPEETIGQLARQSVRVALKLIPQDDGSTRMEIDGRVVQNPMPPLMFDLDLGLRDMDAHQVDRQLISTNVQTLFYGEEPALAAACVELQNGALAAVVAWHPGRFLGVGTLPIQAPAADEWRRAMQTLGCSACRSAPMSTVATSTIRRWNLSGDRP